MAIDDEAPKLYVLSGSRRWASAILLGIRDLPVREVNVEGIEAERFLIEANRQRVKTKGQKIKEYQKLKEIEADLAKQRQGARSDLRAPRNIVSEPGTMSDNKRCTRAAKHVGTGVQAAEQGLAKARKIKANPFVRF